MRRHLGQAALGSARLLHRLAQAALALCVLAVLLIGALGVRLSEGPLDIPWAAHLLEAAASADGPTRLTIGNAQLAWEGWKLGLDRPLDLRLTDIAAVDPGGRRLARLPRAELAVSFRWLLLGRIVPRALEVDGARLVVTRAADGAIRLDLGSLTDAVSTPPTGPPPTGTTPTGAANPGDGDATALLSELTRPPQTDAQISAPGAGPVRDALHTRWAQLRRVRIADAVVEVHDRQLGLDWTAKSISVDLQRRAQGGVDGEANAALAVAGQAAEVRLHARARATGGASGGASGGGSDGAPPGTDLQAELSSFVPAHYAALSPALAKLAALDAPVTLSGAATLDAGLAPTGGSLRVHLDAGQAIINASAVPLLGADLDVRAGGGRVAATLSRLDLAARPDAKTVISGAASLKRAGAGLAAQVDVALDQLSAADLPVLWPKGIGGPGARPWIVGNITAGTMSDAKFSVALAVKPDFSDVALTAISGGFSGHDLTVWWLRPVPPIEHGEAKLAFAGPDTIDITVLAGRQAGSAAGGAPAAAPSGTPSGTSSGTSTGTPGGTSGGTSGGGQGGSAGATPGGGIQLRGGRVHITGIAGKDQYADIDTDLAGPVADVIGLLQNPKIKLLSRRPLEMRNPAGQYAGTVAVTHLWLDDHTTMNDLQIRTTAHMTDVHLGGIAAGRDLDRGMLDLDADNNGLHVKGSADLAAIPAKLTVDMDFRDGPPTQVLTAVTVAGTASERTLAALGVDPGGVVTGPVGIRASLQQLRNGRGNVAAHLDLSQSVISQPRLGVNKAAGASAAGDIALTLDHDRLASIERVSLTGDGILVDGSADIAGGHPNVLRLQRVKLGATTDLHGEVGLPANPGDGYRVALRGPSIDLSREFAHAPHDVAKQAAPPPEAKTTESQRQGTPYLLDAQFDRVHVANGEVFTRVLAHVENDGRLVRSARIDGRTGGDAPFAITVAPGGPGRTLAAHAADLGLLLRGLDVLDNITSGQADLTGGFDDRNADHALSAKLGVSAFRVHDAPIVGKILQAMTLYGLSDAMSGPGLNFRRLDTQLRFSDDVLSLSEARAFSPSLGVTAKGRIDLGRRVLDLDGTVVPAYFFNSLLGDIPLIGRLFSPEQGGGVFAVTYTIRGGFAAPDIGVNPLSALTPGFLRGIFGVFDNAK